MKNNGWKGKPYFPISSHYRSIFGDKVYKIPVTTVDNCPNRQGLKGMETCIFCDVWGSAAHSESQNMSLSHQIQKYRKHIRKKYHAEKFLIYFQAYTNSFEKIDVLKHQFDSCLEFKDVVGFVVGTRPDCISPRLFRLWQEFHEKLFVAVEIGAQSFFDEHLKFMKRGHTHKTTLSALERISQNTSVDLGIHLIFGWPNETLDQIKESAYICNSLPISNVKLHNLHVLNDTPLAELYFQKKFDPITLEHYTHAVKVFLSHLSPRIAVHRLAAFAPRREELIAPEWTADKMKTHQYIIDHLNKHSIVQGACL